MHGLRERSCAPWDARCCPAFPILSWSGLLKELWAKYGRKAVYQQTRFDLDVQGAKDTDVNAIVVASGEDDRREIMAALWRTMPEGIKNRKALISDNVITVVATEEVLLPEMIERGRKVHVAMGGSADV